MKISLGIGAVRLLASTSALAGDFGNRVEHRMDRHGKRIDQRWDRRH